MIKVRQLYKVEFSDGVKGALGIDEHGGLYWNGKLVVTAQRVLLPRWTNLAIVVGALSMLAIAFLNVLTYLNTIPV
jgi:hypothetical protein